MGEIAPVRCPCGLARRGFVAEDNHVATLHITEIHADSRAHYHKTMTEIYLVLEGQGNMELDGDWVPVEPMTAVLIKPLCRHRAVGPLRVVIVAVPAFNPKDEWLDDES